MDALRFFSSCLVLAIVLLRVAQYPVAELQHVFKGSIALITQILQLQYGPLLTFCKCCFQNAKDLKHTQTQNKYARLIWKSSWKSKLAWLLNWFLAHVVIKACCYRYAICISTFRNPRMVVWVWVCTCARMFCSLMSFCLSLLGLQMTTDNTSCPLLGTSHTKKIKSSNSLITNLNNTHYKL